MSHTPPVPHAAQSPFPIEEAPHASTPASTPASVPPTDSAKIAKSPGKAEKLEKTDGVSGNTMLGVGAAIGIGSAAIVAALLYSRKR